MKKLTIDFIKTAFAKENYILLTKKYVNSGQKLKYFCPKKHRGSISFDSWRRGGRCKICGLISSANKRRLSIEFIRGQLRREGYTLLTSKYIDSKQKLEYICSKGHKGKVCWNNWQQGARCSACSGNKRLTINFIRQEFRKEGYTLLSKKYINARHKLKYICPKGHKWFISWDKWKQGKRCRKCRYENNKGENNPNWNSNLTNEIRFNRRDYLEYDKWCKQVKERDDFVCQICGKRGGNLVSHHLESYNNNPTLRTELSNGVCLCEKCHKNFHHQYGYGNNTKGQFEEFKGRMKNENNFKKG